MNSLMKVLMKSGLLRGDLDYHPDPARAAWVGAPSGVPDVTPLRPAP